MTYHAKLIKGGKIVIPAELRRELGFKEGERLVLEREGNSVVLKTYEQIVREVQQQVRAALSRPLTVDDYLREKWAEADSE